MTYPRRPFDDEGQFVGHDHASLRPGGPTGPLWLSPEPILSEADVEALERLSGEWFVSCECVNLGEADAPSPGPDPFTCSTCGERVRAEWSPTSPTQEENPTMQPTTNGHSRGGAEDRGRDLAGKIAGGFVLVLIVLFGLLVGSILIFGIVSVWQAIR